MSGWGGRKVEMPPASFSVREAVVGVPGHTWKPSCECVSTVCTPSPWPTCMTCAYRHRETVQHTACSAAPLDCFISVLLTVLSNPSETA